MEQFFLSCVKFFFFFSLLQSYFYLFIYFFIFLSWLFCFVRKILKRHFFPPFIYFLNLMLKIFLLHIIQMQNIQSHKTYISLHTKSCLSDQCIPFPPWLLLGRFFKLLLSYSLRVYFQRSYPSCSIVQYRIWASARFVSGSLYRGR